MVVAADLTLISTLKGKSVCRSREQVGVELIVTNHMIGRFSGKPKREQRMTELTLCRTWRGERGEEWSSAQGLESILISIQSLMSSNPYENEPGYETARTAEDKKNIKNYVAKVELKQTYRSTQVTDYCPDSPRDTTHFYHNTARRLSWDLCRWLGGRASISVSS